MSQLDCVNGLNNYASGPIATSTFAHLWMKKVFPRELSGSSGRVAKNENNGISTEKHFADVALLVNLK